MQDDFESGKAAPAWVLRQCPSGAGSSPSGQSLVVAKSLKWPGAIAVAAGFFSGTGASATNSTPAGATTNSSKGRRRITNVYVVRAR